jgi:hypothetical protein
MCARLEVVPDLLCGTDRVHGLLYVSYRRPPTEESRCKSVNCAYFQSPR